jgi:hypothetical protein
MQDGFRIGSAVGSARTTRTDLLLESLALHHQLGVLARSNRRFRQADRLLWLLLRWLWPRWRQALVLVQPATVDRWHREGFRRCWRHRSRRPGRPRIESTCRDLIRRLAAENCLWGAPRIHGELLKLGIAISERTVSRYLQGRPTTRSQSWRTFFANHFGNQTCISPVMFADAHDDDIVVDASDVSFRRAPSIDASCAPIHGPSVDWGRLLQHSSLGVRLGHNYLQDRPGARKSRGRDPPASYGLQPASLRSSGVPTVPLRPTAVRGSFAGRVRRRQCRVPLPAQSSCQHRRPEHSVQPATWLFVTRFTGQSEYWRSTPG